VKRVISTTAAPGAVGPYSQAVEANGFVFVSGQLPLDPATGAFVSDNTDEQAEQCIKNLLAVLAAAGCKAEDVVKATVFMIDIGEFSVVNEVYAKYFNGECPARCAMQVGALPKGALVEIEAIAVKP
jgi:putative endoribonuclease L-PSP